MIFVPSSLVFRAAHEVSPFASGIQAVEEMYSNCSLRGRLTYENLHPNKVTKNSQDIEFMRLGDRMRLITGGSPHDEPRNVNQQIIVSNPSDASFFVERDNAGKEKAHFMSSRRGFGSENVKDTLRTKVFLCAAPYSFALDPLRRMFEEGRLEVETPATSSSLGQLVVHVLRMRPAPDVFGSSPEDEWLDFSGEMTVIPQTYWCIESFDLREITEDATAPFRITMQVLYDPAASSEPAMSSVRWTTFFGDRPMARWTLDVDEIQFGVCRSEDFTMAGCGITIFDTTGAESSLPQMFWYATIVFFSCFVILFLIRLHKTRNQGSDS